MPNTPVLLIEDDPDFGAIVSHVLQSAGYKVSWAKDGVEALQMAKIEQPALIVADFMLPSGGGSTFFQRLRMSQQTANTPILILSAVAKEIIVGSVGEEINAYFLSKPYKKDEFLGLLDSLLAGQSRPHFLLHQVSQGALTRGNVLLVYGDRGERSRLYAELVSHSFHVTESDSISIATDALTNARAEGLPAPDAVVIDAEIDFGTSAKFVRHLELETDTRRTPVIVVTGEKSQRAHFAEAQNVTLFLEKPIDPLRLLRHVEELVRPQS